MKNNYDNRYLYKLKDNKNRSYLVSLIELKD